MKNFDDLIQEGSEFLVQGKLPEAKNIFLSALDIKPNHKKTLKKITEIENKISLSNSAIPKKDLSRINSLFQNSRYSEVVRVGLNIIKTYPYSTQVLTWMGISSHSLGKFEDAILCFNRVVQVDRQNFHAFNNLGNAFFELKKYQDALICYDNSIKVNPNFAEAFYNAGNVYKLLERYRDALINYDKALQLRPDYYNVLCHKGEVLANLDNYQEAISIFNKAIKINPNDLMVYTMMGVVHSRFGYKDEAIKTYRMALEIDNSAYEVYRVLSLINGMDKNSKEIEQVNKFLSDDNLDEDSRSRLLSAKGNYEDFYGNYTEAYQCFEESGALKQKINSYSIQDDLQVFKGIEKHSDSFINNRIEITEELPFTPVFIVGMPRSGTSILEQILSSHSKVYGAGELPFMRFYARNVAIGESELNHDLLLKIRNSYINSVKSLTNVKSGLITDKMPMNFLFLGVIFASLPEAKVIHIERDSRAVCWSNFKTFFTDGLNYSFSIKDTVEYFHLYEKLMNLWKMRYKDQIYHVSYENLVNQPKKEIPNLIKYLGLKWEEKCLSPEENERSVRTASSQQVKQKIYKGSSLDWKNYRELIGEKFSSLS